MRVCDAKRRGLTLGGVAGRFQTKPRLSGHGELYYEGKEFEVQMKVMVWLVPRSSSSRLLACVSVLLASSPPPPVPPPPPPPSACRASTTRRLAKRCDFNAGNNVQEKRPGTLSDELKGALGIPEEGVPVPVPWYVPLLCTRVDDVWYLLCTHPDIWRALTHTLCINMQRQTLSRTHSLVQADQDAKH